MPLRIRLPLPYDLAATVRTLGVGSMVDDRFVWTTHTADGGATIAVAEHQGVVDAEAWGPGAAQLLERVPWLVGAHDTPWDPVPDGLGDLVRRTPGLRLAANRAVYETLATTVVGQVVTTREAKRSLRAIVRTFGDQGYGPYPEVRSWPSSDVIASLDVDVLHRFGIERRRGEVLVEVARRAKRLEAGPGVPLTDTERRLRSIRGVGDWTAGIVMGAALGDSDAVPVGDYHLPNLVAWVLAGEPRADDARMLALLEPYRPHRRRVVQLIKQSGLRAPKYGPRTPPRTHL